MIGLDDELDVRDEGRGRVREGTGLTAGCCWCQGAALWGEGEHDAGLETSKWSTS